MALCRLDVPSVMLYGGSIMPGHFHGERVTIQEVFEAVGAHAAGQDHRRGADRDRGVASPGAGACGGQFTANTMAMAFEVLGISPSGFSMVPAVDARQGPASRVEAGELVMDVLERGLRPSDIITRDSLENAIAAIACSGGSTNGVLHLLAIAREIGHRALDRRLRPDQRAHAAAVRPQARRPVRRPRPVRGRRRAARAQAAQAGRACCTRTRMTVTGQHRRRDRRRRPARPRARGRAAAR